MQYLWRTWYRLVNAMPWRLRADRDWWRDRAKRTLAELKEEIRTTAAWAEQAKQEEADHRQTTMLLAEIEDRHRRLYAVVARIHGPDFARGVCEGTRGERASA